MAKDLREVLYRARATMAESARKCSEWAGTSNTSNLTLGYREIDRMMQEGVEDLDRALIDYEQVSIFKLWVCASCGDHEAYEPDPDQEQQETPFCRNSFLHADELVPMELVTVERIS